MRRYPKRPYIIPPPTPEELGVFPLDEGKLFFKIFRIFCVIFFVSGVATFAGVYYWLEDLGVFRISDQLIVGVDKHVPPDNTIVYDRNGKKIGEFFNHYHLYVPYDDLPPMFVKAIVSIEDRNFFRHPGIDLKAIARAARASLKGGSYKQGASTLTQQVVRHYLLSSEKTMNRKILEIFMAIRLEQKLSKQKIIELYCNKLFLGFGSYGVGAAAFRYFGRKIKDLEVHELALIAGLFQSPSRYNPHRYPARAKKRQRHVLRSMVQAGALTKKEYRYWNQKPLVYAKYESINDKFAPYFIDYVRDDASRILDKDVESLGLRIYTTLDSNLQTIANQTFENAADHFDNASKLIIPKSSYRKSKSDELPKVEAALLSTDPTSGEILAMRGGIDYEQSQYNRTYQAMRSPGSVFKPIIYSLALQRGWKWSDVLLVSPVSINGYRPQNYKNNFLSETTLLQALYKSLNTATVEVGAKVGIKETIAYAKTVGINSELKEEPGTFLGSSEVTMLELTTAYGTFANLGIKTPLKSILRITDRNGNELYIAPPKRLRGEQVISPQIAYLMTDGLRSVIQYGTGQGAKRLPGSFAGKTGTSNNSEDNWFVGYSSSLLTSVWLGTDDHHGMDRPATGASMALPLWVNFMKEASVYYPPQNFSRPAGLVSINVNPEFGNISNRGIRMHFLKGNQPTTGHSEFEAIGDTGNFRSLFGH